MCDRIILAETENYDCQKCWLHMLRLFESLSRETLAHYKATGGQEQGKKLEEQHKTLENPYDPL